MSPILGNLIVIVILAVLVALVIRSMWKSRKKGCHCSGDCCSCGGCGGSKARTGSGNSKEQP